MGCIAQIVGLFRAHILTASLKYRNASHRYTDGFAYIPRLLFADTPTARAQTRTPLADARIAFMRILRLLIADTRTLPSDTPDCFPQIPRLLHSDTRTASHAYRDWYQQVLRLLYRAHAYKMRTAFEHLVLIRVFHRTQLGWRCILY